LCGLQKENFFVGYISPTIAPEQYLRVRIPLQAMLWVFAVDHPLSALDTTSQR
jgi:hypothetical protein